MGIEQEWARDQQQSVSQWRLFDVPGIYTSLFTIMVASGKNRKKQTEQKQKQGNFQK